MPAHITRDADDTPPPTWRDYGEAIDRAELDAAGRAYLDLLELRSEQLDQIQARVEDVLKSLCDFAGRITGEYFLGNPKDPRAAALLARAVDQIERMLEKPGASGRDLNGDADADAVRLAPNGPLGPDPDADAD